MHWILQNNIFDEKQYNTLIYTLERHGIPFSIHKVVPFIGELLPDPALNTKNVICIGSYSMRHFAKARGWNPGVFDLEFFDFPKQLQIFGEHMLNHDALVCEFQDASVAVPMFIRPIADSKVFAGQIFDPVDFTKWQRSVCELGEDDGSSLTPETLIQLCPVKKIYNEHRFWIVKGNIVTASTYKIGRRVVYQELPHDNDFIPFVQQMVEIHAPLDVFVIDIANTAKGLKIVEFNTINSCGFYAANIPQLVEDLEESFSQNS